MMNKAKLIDHTLLKPDSTKEQIDTIINEAKAYQFKSVCVNLHMYNMHLNNLKELMF